MRKSALILALTILAVTAAEPARAQYTNPPDPMSGGGGMTGSNSTSAAILVISGWWYNPAEGGTGWGISTNASGHIFIGGFGYSDSGSGAADWLVATLMPTGMTNVYAGTAMRCTNGQSLSSSTYKSPNCATGAESIQLTMLSANAATLQIGARTTQIQQYTSY